MKVLFTGGGTRGHFYPIIAIAESLNEHIEREKMFNVQFYYMSDQPFDERLLFENNLVFKKISTGKLRRYFSLENIIDAFRTAAAVVKAVWQLYVLYPDVVVGKGGYASLPALFAARFLGIPVIIHESDSVPGVVNKWAGKFAEKVAISFPGAGEYFPKEKTAFTGNPIRRAILEPAEEGAAELLNLEQGVPVILVLGGSQGARLINETVIQVLDRLLPQYQIIHQVGDHNLKEVRQTAEALLKGSEHRTRYNVFGFLGDTALRMASGAADLAITRAGSTIFEIAAWGLPAIVVPITESNGNHQRKNAYTYARAGAAEVIEEQNLTPHLLASEVERLMGEEAERARMTKAAQEFARTDAADKIARQIIAVLSEHEK